MLDKVWARLEQIVRVSGHVFAVIDNVVHDSFQVGSRRKVTTIYAVEKL